MVKRVEIIKNKKNKSFFLGSAKKIGKENSFVKIKIDLKEQNESDEKPNLLTQIQSEVHNIGFKILKI